jgi:hypothetical protein
MAAVLVGVMSGVEAVQDAPGAHMQVSQLSDDDGIEQRVFQGRFRVYPNNCHPRNFLSGIHNRSWWIPDRGIRE